MNDDRRLHGDMIGEPESRNRLNTPVLVLDIDVLDCNIAAMAAAAAARGIALRPHAKTHKSLDIAHRQIAAGAIGLCCAKLGEAEALADGGVRGLHLTSPVVSPPAIARLAALARQNPDLSVVVDTPANVEVLAQAMGSAQTPLGVVIDIDPGIRRTGVASAADAVAVARAIAACPSLDYRGVQFYCGSQQHIETYAERRAAIEERTDYLRVVIDALTQAGFAPGMVTGSGTGTHGIDLELGVFTELQVGSYVFMDRQYNDCDLTGGGNQPFEPSLFIDTRVISANASGIATIDAGYKAMATDGGLPVIVDGAGPNAKFIFMGDEHGAVIGAGALALNDRVTLVVPHCDPTVNLYDSLHVVRGDMLIDIWPVTARGRSR